ncbi:MAG: alpha/beta fold hydrolase, partial [Flavobacterium sp.]|uniref:alpha/beta fold hydrolase n=1 Tax=Flavobacterium sp. TaxID=239 RepID=UPI0025BAE328
MKKNKLFWLYVIFISTIITNNTTMAQKSKPTNDVSYNTMQIDNIELFYREAGLSDKPTILLLHGFPSSSFMFRNLINQLKDEYHILAPDFPGFGYSSMPSTDEYLYTFENYSVLLEKFLEGKNVKKCHFYIFDYG